MTDECQHDFAPGNPPKDLKIWELAVRESACKKCGYVHPGLQFMSPEAWARRETLRISGRVALEKQLQREMNGGLMSGLHRAALTPS